MHGGTGTWAVFQRNEAALELEHRACATEQPYLGVHCSPRKGEGAHKYGPKNCLRSTLPGLAGIPFQQSEHT